MNASRIVPLIMLLAQAWCTFASAQQPKSPGDLNLQQRKLEVDLLGVTKRLQDLDQDWQRRWSEERERLKEEREKTTNSLKDERDKAWGALKDDRDKAWTLFTTYIGLLLSAGIGLAYLLSWWLQRLNKELDTKISDLDHKIASLPLLHDKINSLMDELSRDWPGTKRDIVQLQQHRELDQLKSECLIVFLREGKRIYETLAQSSDHNRNIDVIDVELQKIASTMRLTSGDMRYVRQAANIFVEENNINDLAKELLPRLHAIYKAMDPDLCNEIDKLISNFGRPSGQA